MDLMLLTDDQQKHLHQVLTTYQGPGNPLRDALGALLIGKTYGWRVIRVMYGGSAYARYQETLKLDFKQWCEPETEYAGRHRGYQMVGKLEDFWKIIRGDVARPEGFTEAKQTFG